MVAKQVSESEVGMHFNVSEAMQDFSILFNSLIIPRWLCSLAGKAAFLMRELEQSGMAYEKATEINARLLPAWKGLAELHSTSGDGDRLTNALQHLVCPQ